MFEVVSATSLPTGKGYKPTSYYKAGKGEGVFAKALKLKDRVVIRKLSFDGNNWEVVAAVQSESDPNTTYNVNLYLPLDFECDCPHGQHRFNPCKHVFATVLKVLEIAGADIRDPIIRQYVYDGLNKLAYHKARMQRNLA